MLNRDQIKAAHGPKEFTVNVPGWGGDVRIRRMTAADWIAMSERPEGETNIDYLIRLIQLTAIGDDDAPLFDEESKYLLTDSPLIAVELGNKILDLNNLNREKKSDSPTAP